MFDLDEHPRSDTNAEGLAKLPPVFRKDGGRVTAGSASGICDGAAALVIANEAAIRTHNVSPMLRIVGWTVAGVDPKIMGIGPVPAIEKLLAKTKMNLNQIDRIEINEAFAAQVLGVAKALKLDMNKLNGDGGAIACGHPLGASGARIMGHLAHAMVAKKEKYGIGAA
jgi:acetyl-CoA acyltransferase 2